MRLELTSIIINTANLESMLRFYGFLGVKFECKKISQGSECYMALVNGVELTIYGGKVTERTRSPDLQLTFKIERLETVFNDLVRIKGIETLLDPTDLPDGKKAIFLDPDGRAIELIEAK